MDLTKKANGSLYKFADEELIQSFVELCKKSNTEDYKIMEMLESLENSKLESVNRFFEEA